MKMKSSRTRYQEGSTRRVQLKKGFAWEWRYRQTDADGVRRLKAIRFNADEYPTERSVIKAVEQKRSLINSESGRGKVIAPFSVITALYRSEHLPALRRSTQQTNDYLLRDYIEPRWSDYPIRGVTPLAVAEWIRDLRSCSDPKNPLSATTKAGIRSVMRQCFELAALHEFIPSVERNPMSLVRIKGTATRRKRIHTLTPEEFQKLLTELREPVNLMVLLAGCLGLRVSEVLALKWEDIDEADATIAIQRSFTRGHLDATKTRASNARLPVDEILLPILAAWRPKTDNSEWLFPSRITGGPQSASVLLQKHIKPTAERLQLGNIGWHSLRHSCRTWLDSKGTAVGIQKDLLRHSDVSTTMNWYGKSLSPDMRASHHAVVEELVPEALRIKKKRVR